MRSPGDGDSMVPETSVDFTPPTQLIAREDFFKVVTWFTASEEGLAVV
jgi:hypothetical protein